MTFLTGRRVRAGLLGLALFAAAPALAGELKIYPVRLTLTPDEPVATMTLQNGGEEASVYQLKVMSWRQENGEDVFEPTRDVLANPGLFELQSGAEQTARFGLQAGPNAQSRYYRAFIQEVPIRESQAGEVMALLRISVPIFSPSPDSSPRLTWAVKPTITDALDVVIRNQGDGHVQVTAISIKTADGRLVSEDEMSVYVLPNAWRRVTLNTQSLVRPGDRLELTAETDQAPISAAIMVDEADGLDVR